MFISTYFLAKNSLPMPLFTNLPTNATGPFTLIRLFVASPLDYSPTVHPRFFSPTTTASIRRAPAICHAKMDGNDVDDNSLKL
jgi:hypothetical protein